MHCRFPRFVSSSGQKTPSLTDLQHHYNQPSMSLLKTLSYAGVRAASAVPTSGHPSSWAVTVPPNCPFKATFLLLMRDGTRNGTDPQHPWRGVAEPWKASWWEPAWITWVCKRVGQKNGQHCRSVPLHCVVSIYGKPPKCWDLVFSPYEQAQ